MIGVSRKGGKSARRTSSTWRALADSGSTWASTEVNLIEKNGIPSAISSAALASAIRPGKRITSLREPVPEALARRAGVAARRGGAGTPARAS